jgi:hypothetical protein
MRVPAASESGAAGMTVSASSSPARCSGSQDSISDRMVCAPVRSAARSNFRTQLEPRITRISRIKKTSLVRVIRENRGERISACGPYVIGAIDYTGFTDKKACFVRVVREIRG